MIRILLAHLALAAFAATARDFTFTAAAPAEYTAVLRMSGPGTNWSRPGHEAALARVRIDGASEFHIMLFAGETPFDYQVFLGRLAAGKHSVSIETEPKWSAPGATVSVESFSAKPAAADDEVIARAPVLFARENTVGRFSDVPLLVYAEREGNFLTYTVIFSNEDGGTSTRALMGRWGRTTDIEYVYRLDLKSGDTLIQGRDHKDLPFNGKYDGTHPMLIPVTNNNMVSGEASSAIRYQIAPVLVDLSKHSREEVMDESPFSYRIMAEELQREDKLRPYGTVAGQKISDPRNYLYIEAKIANRNSAVAAAVRLANDSRWRTSNLGRVDYAMERDGWIRTTVELPPGTTAENIAEIGFECVLPVDPSTESSRRPVFFMAGECRVDAVSKAFLLGRDLIPGPSIWSTEKPVNIPSGEIATFKIR
jgi:hypothetical protein